MAFTRSELRKILGEAHTEELENKLMNLHLEPFDALKDERDQLKTQVEKLQKAEQERDTLKNELNTLKSGDYQKKYETEHQAFEVYRQKVQQQENAAKVKAEYRKLLVDAHVNNDLLDVILNGTKLEEMKLTDDGKLENEADIKKSIGEQYGKFITTTRTRGAFVETPPESKYTGKSKEEILKIKDTAERQRAIAENHELFGF